MGRTGSTATITALNSLRPGRKRDEVAQRVIRMFKVGATSTSYWFGGGCARLAYAQYAPVAFDCVGVFLVRFRAASILAKLSVIKRMDIILA